MTQGSGRQAAAAHASRLACPRCLQRLGRSIRIETDLDLQALPDEM